MEYNSRTKSHKNTQKVDERLNIKETIRQKTRSSTHHVNAAVQRFKVVSSSNAIKWLS